jgi:hypothetical protein
VTDDLDLEWSAVDGPGGCCWRLCSRGQCVAAKTKAEALDQLEGLLRSSHQPRPPAPP